VSNVIELRDLRKEFGDVVAVRGADLGIAEGEFFTLLGPSGSGKTTVLRMIAGLERPTSGAIVLDGTDVADDPPYERDVNTVFQDYALFPHMTVRENVGYGLEIRGADDDAIDRRVADLLDLVSLPGVGDRDVDQLSGGQQQRVALARALAIEPEVLLLDEPLGALDEKLRREMQVELKEIQEELGTTFVYVTHDQEEALSMSDRIAVLDAGELIQVDTPEEVYKRPRTRFIAEFFRGSNIFEASVVETGEDTVLSFADQTVRSTDALPPGADDRATFFVRSEAIAAGGEGTNALTGTITNVVYRGGTTDYTVDVGGHEVVVSLGDDGHEEGETLALSWDPADTVLLGE
jgi:spermidine/putrescine ABC transporter ATP-binding subunit